MTPKPRQNGLTPEGLNPERAQPVSAAATEQPQLTEPEERKTVFAALREAYLRARDGHKKSPPEKHERTARSANGGKSLLVLAVAVIVMLFVFLGMFSSSSGTKERAANRTKPHLGRPDTRSTSNTMARFAHMRTA